MNYLSQTSHVIKYGDTLYDIATNYNTTVDLILGANPYLNPYNLPIGSFIIIPYYSYDNQRDRKFTEKEVALLERMNMLWEQHIMWTRMLLISIAENLKDLEETKKRLLLNPGDIAKVYEEYYGYNVANNIKKLLTEHLTIGGDLIVALKNDNQYSVKTLQTKWYKNADDMAEYFSSINPYYNKEELRQMLYKHLDLTTNEVTSRFKKDYASDIKFYDMVQKEALAMANYFTRGILNQFPNKF